MTDETFMKLPFAFPKANISTFKLTKVHAEFLAAFKPIPYDCCVNSCCCYAGPHAAATAYPYCQEPCYNPEGHPCKQFTYVPFTPCLTTYYQNKSFIEKSSYQANYHHEPGKIKDIMDSKNYARLCKEYVTINQKHCPYRFFNHPQDIVLGMLTDGFAPFRRCKQTCSPLLLYNYNLPPEICFHLQYILCIGVIPSPKKPKDFDSFFWPALEELLKLAMGVRAFDAA